MQMPMSASRWSLYLQRLYFPFDLSEPSTFLLDGRRNTDRSVSSARLLVNLDHLAILIALTVHTMT